eukprot:g13088.t1
MWSRVLWPLSNNLSRQRAYWKNSLRKPTQRANGLRLLPLLTLTSAVSLLAFHHDGHLSTNSPFTARVALCETSPEKKRGKKTRQQQKKDTDAFLHFVLNNGLRLGAASFTDLFSPFAQWSLNGMEVRPTKTNESFPEVMLEFSVKEPDSSTASQVRLFMQLAQSDSKVSGKANSMLTAVERYMLSGPDGKWTSLSLLTPPQSRYRK